ncbi:MAG: hypothetical protein AB1435_08975 [Chloroflexota bacterium]
MNRPTSFPDRSPADRAARLAALERERAELLASLPAHSLPPALLMRIEEIEEAIAALRRPLAGDHTPPEAGR